MMKLCISSLIVLCGSNLRVQAWLPSSLKSPSVVPSAFHRPEVVVPTSVALRSSDVSNESPATTSGSILSVEEQQTVESLFEKSSNKDDTGESLKQALLEELPTMSPKLIIKLRQCEADENVAVRQVARTLNAIMAERLDMAKETLMGLLNAGEIRKLDGLIGKAAREGRLDAAFFNVLTINLQNAKNEEMLMDPEKMQELTKDGAAPRSQILQHVYTRCQEEVEKTIAPGMALLNKLLRTEQDSIRSNLYSHYLTPQPDFIETPDGKKVELKNAGSNVLVPLDEFIKAIDTAVVQVRTVQKAGVTDPASAAAMVEACRQVAKEARIIIGKHYGLESAELKAFEEGLQPVFRPASPDSPYIQGRT